MDRGLKNKESPYIYGTCLYVCHFFVLIDICLTSDILHRIQYQLQAKVIIYLWEYNENIIDRQVTYSNNSVSNSR